MRILGIIPARFASTRLPGKPLADIGGRSMVQRVWEQARQCDALDHVIVATDDARIVGHVQQFGADVVLTRQDHPSGTDRCHEAMQTAPGGPYDAVVNIQGDEPFIAPAQIAEVCHALNEAPDGLATLAHVVSHDGSLDDPNTVRVVTDVHMNALYFSRATIPFLREGANGPRHARFRYLQHVGIYGYTVPTLARIVAMAPSSLERAEGLEQLRWLENGLRIRVGLTAFPSFSVDTPADLEEARERATEDELRP